MDWTGSWTICGGLLYGLSSGLGPILHLSMDYQWWTGLWTICGSLAYGLTVLDFPMDSVVDWLPILSSAKGGPCTA